MTDKELMIRLEYACHEYMQLLDDMKISNNELKNLWNTKSGRIFSDSFDEVVNFARKAASSASSDISMFRASQADIY